MSGPVLAVRVAATVEEFKRNLQDGVVNQVEVVRSSLVRMANAYDPQVLIQRAGTTAAAIQQVGGVSVLSADQMARANRVVDEGVAAYQRLGQQAPIGLTALSATLKSVSGSTEDLGGRTTITSGELEKAGFKVDSLRGTWKTFDNVLQASGITIGSEAKGLIQLAEASGHTASELGALATVGLAAGAAFAGWKVGRWIADLTGADEAIAHLTATLLGYGDVAAQTVGAKQDVINRAIAAGAAATISYTEAIRFNIEAEQHRGDVYVTSGQRLSDAQREVRNLDAAVRDEIIRAKEAGATEEMLHRVYGISVEAIKALVHQKEIAIDAAEKLKKKHEEEAASLEKLNAQYRDYNNWLGQRRMEDEAAAAIKRKTDAGEGWYQAMLKIAGANRDAAAAEQAFLTEQDKITAENDSRLAQQAAIAESTQNVGAITKASVDGATDSYKGLGQQITVTGDAIKEWLNLMQYAAKAQAILSGGSSLFTTQSQRERIAAIPSFAGGVENFAGGVAKVHKDEALVYMPQGTSVIPASRASGGSSSITIAPVINVSGSSSSASDISDAVSTAILNLFRSGAIPMPSPV